MNQKLTDQQIMAVAQELAQTQRQVSVRLVMQILRGRYAASGRTERVSQLLKDVLATAPSPPKSSSEEVRRLQEQLLRAEKRATRAEELERAHQDFWARRYADKMQEFEARMAAVLQAKAAASAEAYLRLSQRTAELEQRLAELISRPI